MEYLYCIYMQMYIFWKKKKKKTSAHFRGLSNCIVGYVVISDSYAQVKYHVQIQIISDETEEFKFYITQSKALISSSKVFDHEIVL